MTRRRLIFVRMKCHRLLMMQRRDEQIQHTQNNARCVTLLLAVCVCFRTSSHAYHPILDYYFAVVECANRSFGSILQLIIQEKVVYTLYLHY